MVIAGALTLDPEPAGRHPDEGMEPVEGAGDAGLSGEPTAVVRRRRTGTVTPVRAAASRKEAYHSVLETGTARRASWNSRRCPRPYQAATSTAPSSQSAPSISHLEGRLLAVLDPARPRQVPPPRAQRAGWAGLAMFVLPLAALTPVAGRLALVNQVAAPEPTPAVRDPRTAKAAPAT